MMECKDIQKILQEAFPQGKIEVSDMTGTSDHFHIEVFDPIFDGKNLLIQHRMVQTPLRDALEDGRIHAIQIKTGPSRSRESSET